MAPPGTVHSQSATAMRYVCGKTHSGTPFSDFDALHSPVAERTRLAQLKPAEKAEVVICMAAWQRLATFRNIVEADNTGFGGHGMHYSARDNGWWSKYQAITPVVACLGITLHAQQSIQNKYLQTSIAIAL